MAETRALSGHKDWVTAVAEVDSVGTIATASKDKTVKLWSNNDSTCVKTFVDFEDCVNDIAVLNESTMVAISGCSIHVLSIESGQVLATWNTEPVKLQSCAAIDTKTVIVGDKVGSLTKIEWESSTINMRDNAHNDWIRCIFSSNGRFATCSDDKTAKLWDSATMDLIHEFNGHTDWVHCVTFDDTHLVTACDDFKLRVYDVVAGVHVRTITSHCGFPYMLNIASHGNIIVSGGFDELVMLHNITNGQCIAKYRVQREVTCGTLLKSGQLTICGLESCDIVVPGSKLYDTIVFEIAELGESVAVNDQTAVVQNTGTVPDNSLPTPSSTREPNEERIEFLEVRVGALEDELSHCRTEISQLRSCVEQLMNGRKSKQEQELINP